MSVKVTKSGHLTIPAKFRKRDNLKSGQKFEVIRLGPGDYLLKRIPLRRSPRIKTNSSSQS